MKIIQCIYKWSSTRNAVINKANIMLYLWGSNDKLIDETENGGDRDMVLKNDAVSSTTRKINEKIFRKVPESLKIKNQLQS